MTVPYLGGGESEFKVVSFVKGRSNVSTLWQTYFEKTRVILSLVAPEGKLDTKTYGEVGCEARKLEIVCGGVVYFVTSYLVAVRMLWIKIITGGRWLMVMPRWIDLLNMLDLWSGIELLYRISASYVFHSHTQTSPVVAVWIIYKLHLSTSTSLLSLTFNWRWFNSCRVFCTFSASVWD